MKHCIVMLILILIGQNSPAQRMIPHQKSIETSLGLLSNGLSTKQFAFNLAYISNAQQGDYWIYAVEYCWQSAKSTDYNIPIDTYTAEIGYAYHLLSTPSKSINLYTTILGIAGYQDINRGQDILEDGAQLEDVSSLIYGGAGKLSIETYASDRIVLSLQLKTRAIWGSSLSHFRSSFGLGIRYNF